MATIAGKPLLLILINYFNNYGFTDFIICVKDSDSEIKTYFEELNLGFSVQVVKTGNDTPTGGRIKKIEALVNSSNFIVTYGDGLADIDLLALVKFHENNQLNATITAVQPMNQYGVLGIDSDQNVTSFLEKPRMKEWINGGFFVFKKAIFTLLKEDSILEKGPLETLSKQRQLKAFCHDGFWKSMDTYKDYEEMNKQLPKYKCFEAL